MTTAAVAETTAVTETDETSAHNASLSIGLIAAALARALPGIGGGIAVAAGRPGRHRRQQRKPQDLGKSLIFVALGESIALYGLVISIMILSRLV